MQDDPQQGSLAHTMGFNEADIAATLHAQEVQKCKVSAMEAQERAELDGFRVAATTSRASSSSTPAIHIPHKKAREAIVLPKMKRRKIGEKKAAPKILDECHASVGPPLPVAAADEAKPKASDDGEEPAGLGGLVVYSSDDGSD